MGLRLFPGSAVKACSTAFRKWVRKWVRYHGNVLNTKNKMASCSHFFSDSDWLQLRTHGARNVDAVMSKSFAVSIKDHKITTQFRAEFYNLFNHTQFAAPNGSVSSQSFGQVTSIANAPRDLQFGLKIGF
jgi:hypothetical protein